MSISRTRTSPGTAAVAMIAAAALVPWLHKHGIDLAADDLAVLLAAGFAGWHALLLWLDRRFPPAHPEPDHAEEAYGPQPSHERPRGAQSVLLYGPPLAPPRRVPFDLKFYVPFQLPPPVLPAKEPSMSTPNPVPAAPSLGQSLLAIVEHGAAGPVSSFLTALEAASGDPIKDAAAGTALVAQLTAVAPTVIGALQTEVATWAHGRLTAWLAKQPAAA